MGMFTKIKDWIGTQLDVYKVEDASDIGPGLKKHIWVGKDMATQQGTTLTAQLMNELQKGLLFSTNGTRTVGSNKDIYTLDIQGMKEFGIFNGLNLLLRVDGINQYSNVVLKIDDREYQIFRLKNGSYKYFEKGMLIPGRDYLIHFDGTQFIIIQDFNFGTETDTVLEGKRLAEIIGLEFGGNIQDTGNKVKGKFYFDNVTKFYYECTENTNLTYNDATKFRSISNKPISDKVEGLLEVGNNYLKFSNGIILGFGTCIASPSGTMNNYGINMGEITSLILTVNGGAYTASGETISGTTFKARTNAAGNVSASYLVVGKWK